MKIYCTKHFAKLAKKADVTDDSLREAVTRADAGTNDAKLFSGLIKQRIARENEGRSGGFRSIVFYETAELSVFLHLFPKSQQDNLTVTEKKMYRKIAKAIDGLQSVDISKLLKGGEWKEIEYDDHKEGREVSD